MCSVMLTNTNTFWNKFISSDLCIEMFEYALWLWPVTIIFVVAKAQNIVKKVTKYHDIYKAIRETVL